MVGAIKAPRERERDERVCVCVSQRDRVGERGMRYSVCVCARAARVCVKLTRQPVAWYTTVERLTGQRLPANRANACLSSRA